MIHTNQLREMRAKRRSSKCRNEITISGRTNRQGEKRETMWQASNSSFQGIIPDIQKTNSSRLYLTETKGQWQSRMTRQAKALR